ncbi:N-terminal region of Chorein a TM vesicle-mediated sorter family protein [Babesia bovis T2Bo]|uniref:Chorein N-terminal domain-containing protein n=1 Tax=Babesia bovis TaxID=5865 RepID=A7AWL4_BABBO|nr:N-terminal region of Chorein a TM vesicle-mediated sorter family protein [Babesia bovis T2Bo]EDO05442.1 N-terminal region of Chorein a TM vesicle-mediated sorter family protein [Babesia bovis T2Bo]|eukprot:XP_001609010.1 hypothetical protein [Babesia bovis T2Bo]
MMLEKKIISLLHRLLKPFIEGIDENTLHLRNLLSGNVVLTGLRLKPSIVHSLGLPYHLTFGLIDEVKLTVRLPLLSLSKSKLVLEINNVVLLLTSLPETQWDSASFREEHMAHKVTTLAAESLHQVVTEIEGGGFLWRTVLYLLDNLEVRIANIHLRIEDYITNPRLSYAFGCMVKSAVVLSGMDPSTQSRGDAACDTPFHRSFYTESGAINNGVIHRRIEVHGVGAYIDRLDPLRPGNTVCGSGVDPAGDATPSANEVDECLFMDARSRGSGASYSYGLDNNHRCVHFVRVARRHRLRYCAAPKSKSSRKEFRIKCCRPGDISRNRLRFVRYSYDPAAHGDLGLSTLANALACTNAMFGGVISRVMNYLSSGDHNAGCDGSTRTGWHNTVSAPIRVSRRHRCSTGGILTPGHRYGLWSEGRGFIRRDRGGHRFLLPDYKACLTSRSHPLNPVGLSTGATCVHCRGSPCCCGVSLSSDNASVCSSHGAPDANVLGGSVGYSLSPGSTWRILLSTFCDIQQPEEQHHFECSEMIHNAQLRYATRHRVHRCSTGDNTSCSQVSVKLPTDSSHSSDEPRIEGLDSSGPGDSASCFGICGNRDCVFSEPDSDIFDEDEYRADHGAPLSYDETWHVRGFRDTPDLVTTYDTAPDKATTAKRERVDMSNIRNLRTVGDSWTRLSFVMNRNEDPAMKELFLRLLDEANHNYIVNPKEVSGVLSLYFCMYPIKPSLRPRSCWSDWGRQQDSKLYKESIASARDYLPRCGLFIHFEGLNVVVSKDQLECLYNMLFEGIMKHFSWQSGIIYTFEHARPTADDQRRYMEYWPQHLLGQSSQSPEIGEFISDFEILHSIQATRILRKNASDALRSLIQSFGERTGFCPDARECLTDVLVTNICGRFDDTDVDTESGEEHSRLQARLKLVGGIYEIATKHAKSHAFLDSLRKICLSPMTTFDFMLDLILMDSRVSLTFEVEPSEHGVLAAKAYVCSLRGLHFFLSDIYGRDGCQVMEVELLPFSVVSFGFNLDSDNAEQRLLKDCACRLLEGPATLLLSCGEYVAPSDADNPVPADSRISDVIYKPVFDSNIYFGISFNRYCTPSDADTRVLLHLNSDLFGHLKVLDEYRDFLRMRKHNQSQNDTVNPVLVGSQKKIYHLSQDKSGSYTELYELIDLGIEYYRNLLQGPLPFMNLYLFVEVSRQVCFFLGSSASDSTLPYALCMDSFAIASDVKPRFEEPQAEVPYDCHLVRASNISLLSVNCDYRFLSDGGRREVYLGTGGIKLLDYLSMTCGTIRRRGCDDPVIALSLSKLQNNFEVVSLGRDNELFIKFRWANSLCSRPRLPQTVITFNLGSVYMSLRELDIGTLLGAYKSYVKLTNDYHEYISRVGGYRVGDEVTPDDDHGDAVSSTGYSVRSRRSNAGFTHVVSKLWRDLQVVRKQRALERARSVLYELKLDYLFLELRKPIVLDLPANPVSNPSDGSSSPSEDITSGVSTVWPSGSPVGGPSTRRASRIVTEDVEMARMVILPSSEAGVLPVDTCHNLSYGDYWTTTEAVRAISRRAPVSNIQAVLTSYGITAPLLSLKVTGVGCKVCYNDRGIERLRAFVGCIEVEDQSNAVPLYVSTMLSGGDTTLFWRWLKVSREVHRVRQCLYSYSEGMNHVMNNLVNRPNAQERCGRLNRNSTLVTDLRHVDYDSIVFRHQLSHDYHEEPFFQLAQPNSHIARAYTRVEHYIRSVMDYSRAADITVQSMHESTHVGQPCLMTASLDFDQCQRGRCVVAFSNMFAGVCWEVLDEIIAMCSRICDRWWQIPPWFNASAATPTQAPNLDATLSVAQSSVYVLCDSAWFGYRNFIDYMWYKVLRDRFNIVDMASVSNSRACSIADPGDMRSSMYVGTNERAFAQRVVPGTATSISDTYTGAMKMLVDKRREHHSRLGSREQVSIVSNSVPVDHQGKFNAHLLWTFLASVLRETHRKAYMITPIYMQITGRGTIFISVRASRNEPVVHDYVPVMRPTATHRPSHAPPRSSKIFAGYSPMRFYMRASGSNISGVFSRTFSSWMLSPCGFSRGHRRRSFGTDEHKREQYDFMKYMTQRSKSDLKLYGLLESSKHTLYDLQDPVDSRFIEPFRMEVCTSLLVTGPGSDLPQSLCLTIDFQTVKVALSCIDVLSLYSVVGIINALMELDPSIDLTNPVLEMRSRGSSKRDDQGEQAIAEASSNSDGFYSCLQSSAESDWVSVVSSNQGVEDLEALLPERKYSVAKNHFRRSSALAQLGFVERLLNELSIGLRIGFNLLHIEVSSNAANELANILTVTIEDFGMHLWANEVGSTSPLGHVRSLKISDVLGHESSHEPLSVLGVYTDDIDTRIALCIAGAHSMLSQCCSTDTKHKCRGGGTNSLEGLPLDTASLFSGDQPLIRFESRFSVTLDVCRDLRREMLVEPFVVCLRGSKPGLVTKTSINISTSWINTNISLNVAQCVFGFMKHITEMSRLRKVLVDESEMDYQALQPAPACRLDKDVTRSVIPLNMLRTVPGLHVVADYPGCYGLLNRNLPVWEVPAAIEFRLLNNLLHCSRFLDVHAAIMAAVHALGLLKFEAEPERNAIFVGDDASPMTQGNTDPAVNVERSRELHSELVNSLGQPIALCLYVNPVYDRNDDHEWRIIEDGGRCELPVGHYGIILPFVVRIQLNNCIYEIPSSMLNLTQEDEMMFRLDVSRVYQRGRNTNRMGFLRTMRNEHLGAKMYRFGVAMPCARFTITDFASGTNRDSTRNLHRRRSFKGWSANVIKKVKSITRAAPIPLHLFEHEVFKYAYVMVRTQQRVSGKMAVGASVSNRFTIQLSSTLWISNHSHENLVIFPSMSVDKETRVIPSSSLVWLSLNAPLTAAFPLSRKTVECNRAIDVVKSVGNNLFKQLTNMQENRAPMKHLTPAHVMGPGKVDDLSSRTQEFRLQHILLTELSYKNQRISIPLAWTIEPEATICVCLQQDFPVDLDTQDTCIRITKHDRRGFDFLSTLQPFFIGDVLLSSKSAHHLYHSFEMPRIKMPIPDYVARVNVGQLDPDDIFACDLNTGFVQDINITRKARDTFRTQSMSSAAIVKSQSHSVNLSDVDRDSNVVHSGSLSPDHKPLEPLCSIDLKSPDESQEIQSISIASSSGIEPPVCPEIPLPLNGDLLLQANTGSVSTDSNQGAYVVRAQTFARLSTITDKDATPVTGLVLKRRMRVEHPSSARDNGPPESDSKSKLSIDLPLVDERFPKSILSSTLIEVTSSSRSRFGMKSSGRAGIRHFEIALESCHVIENMMPFDVQILSPATFDYLNRCRSPEAVRIEDVPLYPILIKACSRSRFAWYMKYGRFVLKELVSREFNLKSPTDTIDQSNLVFDAMQPKFQEAYSAILDIPTTPRTPAASGAPPRRLVVSVEISKKPTEPFNERNCMVKRYLASTQYVYTIFVDKWIVNWLDYPISLCRGDGRYKQTIPAQNCSLVSQDLSSTSLQLAIRKTTLRHIPNFESYPKRARRRIFSFDRSSETHVMSNTFTLPDLAFSTCDFADTTECPRLNYLISTSMAPAPFFRTSVLEILPQTTVTNQFSHPLWLREPDIYAPGNVTPTPLGNGWYIVEPGATVELHSQSKGELVVEITGIDPSSYSDEGQLSQNVASPNQFTIWSSGISLKPSNVIQFRYPASVSTSPNMTQMVDKPKRHISGVAKKINYGLCEAEIRMHRGAKVVRFMKPSLSDWIVLNTTGLDLWVEQQGVPGYGEVVTAVGTASGEISERYAGVGVHFACYDPGKEQKLICRFHVGPRSFKQLVGQMGKGARRKNDSVGGAIRGEIQESLINPFNLKNSLNQRAVRVKGSLKVNLSRVESMRCSAVFQLRYGNTVISMRLTAQTCVAFGQKTLHFTAARIPTRGFLRLNRIHPLQLLHIYTALKDKLSVQHDVGYMGYAPRRQLKRLVTTVRDAIPTFCGTTVLGSLKPSNLLKCIKRMIRGSDRLFETLPRPSTSKPQGRTRKTGLFNWDYIFEVNVLGLGLAICGHVTEELLYISGALIKFKVTLDNDEHLFNLSMGWIQSDVHDPSTCYATMLRPLASWQSPARTYDLKQRVQGRALHLGTHDGGIDSQSDRHVITITFNTRGNEYFSVREITDCRIELEPLSLNLDTRIGQSILLLVDEFVAIFGFTNVTAEYFTTANVGIFAHVDTWLRNFDAAEYPLKEVAQSQFSQSMSTGTRYNISNLHVGRIALAINIRRSGSRFSSDLQAQNVVIRHLMHIVRRTPHISDANIILAQESLLELCCTPYALLSHFIIRYITQGVQQIYKVLGAVDLIGNPKIVVHHWINGVCQAASIMKESLQYLHLPPVAVFLWFRSVSRIGVCAVSGIADALYRLTGSWYLIFNTLALNSDRYAVFLMQDTFGKGVDQPSNVMDGVVFGGRSIGRNLYVSVGNFAFKPIHQLMRFWGALKTVGTVNGEVMLSAVHIIGSMLSAMASLTFGTVSSLLNGVSMLSQGLLHQIHSVPMLSAIRPQRSINLLQVAGPIRYNFLESWSMSATRQVSGVNELLVLLPLDMKLKMFDPMQAATSHWSALSAQLSMISPIAVCTPSSALTSYLWVNRTHVGLIHRRKVLWTCESKCIRSIEVIRVPAMKYQTPGTMRYDDSIEVETTFKAARKHFSRDSYYIRIIHVTSDSTNPPRFIRGSIPMALFKRLTEEDTFPSNERGLMRLQGAAALQSQGSAFTKNVTPRGRRETLVNRYYRTYLSADLAGITIDKYERHIDEMPAQGTIIKSPLITPKPESARKDGFKTMVCSSMESTAANKSITQHEGSNSGMFAEVVRLPNLERAQLYFTLLISVLRESAL